MLDGRLARIYASKLKLVGCITYYLQIPNLPSLRLEQSIFIFYFVKYTPIKYAEYYHYPWWGEVIGFIISFSSMIWVPGMMARKGCTLFKAGQLITIYLSAYAIYYLMTTKGTLMERLRKGVKPAIKMRPDAVSAKKPSAAAAAAQLNAADLPKDVEMNLIKNIDTSNHA